MIKKEVYDFIRLYRSLIEKAKKDEISIFEIQIDPNIIGTFDNMFQNALIIALLSELVKLKAEYLYNKAIRKEETKQLIEKVFRKVLKNEGFSDEDIETLLMIDSMREKLKKPKSISPPRMSYQEFKEMVKDEIKDALHKGVDYNMLAEEVAIKIKEGTFKIRSIRDFIAFLFAAYNFNLDVDYKSLF